MATTPNSTPPPVRVVFAGTPEFAAVALQALIGSPHELCGVYTQPDRPAGRGRQLRASPVKQLAQQHGLPVYQPVSLREPDVQRELAALASDVMVVGPPCLFVGLIVIASGYVLYRLRHPQTKKWLRLAAELRRESLYARRRAGPP